MLHDRTDPNELEVVLIEDESALPIERQYALLTVNYYSVAAVCAAHRIIRRFRGPDLGLGPIEKVALAGRQAAGRIDHDLAGDEGGHDGGRGLHQRTEDGPCNGPATVATGCAKSAENSRQQSPRTFSMVFLENLFNGTQ